MKSRYLFWLLVLMTVLNLAACTADGQTGPGFDANQDMSALSEEEQQMVQLGMYDGPVQNISSVATTISSQDYPQTKAIMVQPAQYIYTDVQTGIIPGLPGQQPGQPQAGPEAGQWAMPDQQEQQQQDQPQQQEQQQAGTDEQDQDADGLHEFERRVVELTNAERANQGLPALQMDTHLSSVAREKSDDMQENNYFSHASPTHGSPFDMMKNRGVSFNSAAENIAMGQRSPEEVVQAWMNSAGHRQNILGAHFTHLGIGYNPNGHYWTQLFVSR